MAEFIENGRNGHMTEEEWASLGVTEHINGWADAGAATAPLMEQDDPYHGLEFASDIVLDTASNDIIADLIGPGDLAVVYGPSGGGKTFVAIELGFCLALGLPIAGKDTRTAAVLYVGYEGARGIKKRFMAARRKFRDSGRHVARLTLPAPLGSSNGAAGLKAITEAVGRLKAASGCENVVVIIDTLSRAIAGDDENLSKDMSAFIERRAGEITRRTGAAIICVHHTGKDESRGMRGSSALFAACDAVVSVIDQRVTVEKSKDGESGPWFVFELKQVRLGEDDRGKPITSCVVAERDAAPAKPANKSRPKGATAEACQILQQLYSQLRHSDVSGAEVGISDAEPTERWRVVELEDWKAACRAACLTVPPDEDTPKAASKREWAAFERAVTSLAGTFNLIGRHGKYVWLVSANQKRTGRSVSTVLHSSTNVEPVECLEPAAPASSTVLQGSTNVEYVEPVESAESSTGSTPPYKGVEPVEPDVANSVVSKEEERGRKKGSSQEEIEPAQPNGEAITQSSSLPRKLKPPHERPGDHARSMGSTGALADVGPVAPGNGNDEPLPCLLGRIEI